MTAREHDMQLMSPPGHRPRCRSFLSTHGGHREQSSPAPFGGPPRPPRPFISRGGRARHQSRVARRVSAVPSDPACRDELRRRAALVDPAGHRRDAESSGDAGCAAGPRQVSGLWPEQLPRRRPTLPGVLRPAPYERATSSAPPRPEDTWPAGGSAYRAAPSRRHRGCFGRPLDRRERLDTTRSPCERPAAGPP